MANTSAVRRRIRRVKEVWSELDYAQRRLFEIRTGVPATSPRERFPIATTAEELETLYALQDPRAKE